MAVFYIAWMNEDDIYCAMGKPVSLQTRDWKFNFKIRDVCFGFVFVRLTMSYK